MNKPKMKSCKVCKNRFAPWNSLVQVCSYGCALEYGKRDDVKEKVSRALRVIAKKEQREARERLKTRADWLKQTQAVFNQYIRLRDKDEPCISCQRHHTGQYHAGHYRSVGACSILRFHELNVHKQCSVCNNHKSGNAIEYRINLVKKIGVENVEWLESQNKPRRYEIDELKQIHAEYKLKIKEFKNE